MVTVRHVIQNLWRTENLYYILEVSSRKGYDEDGILLFILLHRLKGS